MIYQFPSHLYSESLKESHCFSHYDNASSSHSIRLTCTLKTVLSYNCTYSKKQIFLTRSPIPFVQRLRICSEKALSLHSLKEPRKISCRIAGFIFHLPCPKIQDHRIKPQLTFQQFFSAGIFVIRDSIGNKRLILSVCDSSCRINFLYFPESSACRPIQNFRRCFLPITPVMVAEKDCKMGHSPTPGLLTLR